MIRDRILDIIAVTYGHNHELKCFVESILAQKNPAWRMLVMHDGPIPMAVFPDYDSTGDKRIDLQSTEVRFNDWGHTLRDIGLQKIEGNSYYTLITNCDNYYTPNFIDEMCMLPGEPDLVYCNCVHSHWNYEARETALHRRAIDMGAFVVKTEIAKKVGFKHRDYAADWLYLQDILALKPTIRKVNKVLFCHN